MSGKTITPTLGEKSFSCPHCGAIAHQTWYKLYTEGYSKDNGPWMPGSDLIERIEKNRELDDKQTLVSFFKRKMTKELFREPHQNSSYLSIELVNLHASLCYSCDKYSLWIADDLLYPTNPSEVLPNEDMPEDVKLEFLEAAKIVDKSPRGAVALLRLCVQRLMPHLGLQGKKIDDDIGELVKRGLDGRIQKALDVVRVVGNNAVHPGQIDLRDDKTTASKLFGLVNIIVEAMISTPKHIDAMYGTLPEGALAAIEKRDQLKAK